MCLTDNDYTELRRPFNTIKVKHEYVKRALSTQILYNIYIYMYTG